MLFVHAGEPPKTTSVDIFNSIQTVIDYGLPFYKFQGCVHPPDRYNLCTMNENGIVEELREKIERRHRDALAALDILETYLRETVVPTPPQASSSVKKGARRMSKRTGRIGTYREQVLRVLDATWMTVDEIATKAELDPKRVRGVVYAIHRDSWGIAARRTKRGAIFHRSDA